ncbi:MAG: endolytic transglycosylase MltG [Bacteroidaceae bacterium]|nr:endolytic transglycosylase MltG [Bacteroidaceae bacterium]
MKLKWIFITLGTIMVAGVILAAYAYYLVKSPIVKIDNTSYIYIYPNDSASTIIKKIQEAVHPANISGFKLLAYHNNLDKQKRTGKYAIYDGDNMHTLYRRIVSNQQTPVKVTVPATRTIEQMVGIVCNQLMIDSVQLNEFTVTPGFYNRIGYTEETLPTLFLPNTYEVYWNIEPERFIIRMMKERRAFWNEERCGKAAALGLTIEEVATLASIVDEETNNDAEKPIVAGLYVNRLKRGMLLQADPTVKYALGDFTRKRILKEDLETDSPYNTYKYKGLPPGPIRIPTLQAIESVLNHTKHNYIYMCAKEDFSGTHNFATTLAEHNANARRYQQALNRLKINK